MKTIDTIKAFFVGILAAVSGWLGVLAVPFYLLVLTNIIDYGTGIMAAVHRGEKINSTIGIWGIAKKVCMWLLVVVGAVADFMIKQLALTINIDLGIQSLVALVVVFWLMANELISILENINDIGVNYPEPLKKILELVKDKTEGTVSVGKEK